MISSAALVAFLATSVVLIAIPGPSVMFIIGRTLAEGRRAGILTVLFNSLGHTTWMIAVAFGLGQFLKLYPTALQAIQIVGAIYLGYLGVQTIRHRNDESRITASTEAKTPIGKLAREGFLVGFSNAKVAVFFMAVLPQFVSSGENFTIQFLILGFIFEVMGITGDILWALLAGTARNWIFAKGSRLHAITAIGGGIIFCLGLFLLFTSVINPN